MYYNIALFKSYYLKFKAIYKFNNPTKKTIYADNNVEFCVAKIISRSIYLNKFIVGVYLTSRFIYMVTKSKMVRKLAKKKSMWYTCVVALLKNYHVKNVMSLT